MKTLTFREILQVDQTVYTRNTSTPEAFTELLAHGFCDPIESITTSMMGALLYAARADIGMVIYCAKAAYAYPSRNTTPLERWNWMRSTIQRNTGLDIGTPNSHGLG